MIIESLTLHDFGLYRGRNTIDLTPVHPDKPIILIGGLNGRGKTTILDAINLVLYGNRANLSNRKKKSWEQYLSDSINNQSRGEASVGMALLLEDEFGIRRYEITRSWMKAGKSIKEFFDVRINGEIDKVLSDQWPDFIESLLPIEVASLNFFDGEKVESLADPEKSKTVIASALKGMLGLGLLEKLEADLKVYLRRAETDEPTQEVNPEVAITEAEIEQIEKLWAKADSDRAHFKPETERLAKEIKGVESAASALGSENWQRRNELIDERNQLSMRKFELEQSLIQAASGGSPLRLLTEQLDRALQRANFDQNIKVSQILLEVLEVRDAKIVKGVSQEAKSEIEMALKSDREERKLIAAQKLLFNNPDAVALQISNAVNETTEDLELQNLLSDLEATESSLVDIGRRIATLPADDQIAPLLEKLGGFKEKFDAAENKLHEIDETKSRLDSQKVQLEGKLQRLLEAEADSAVQNATGMRAREYARRSLLDINELAKLTLLRNIPQIENQILERFNSLIGKSDLLSKITIDASTLELSITAGNGSPMTVDRLSAGERQLLAMATLWGLSTVAGRPMPIVIDSPLGKLDKTHRTHIASRYFPKASEQVIILSTDTEVVDELYQHMEYAISREYELDFDEDAKVTTISDGFFKRGKNAN